MIIIFFYIDQEVVLPQPLRLQLSARPIRLFLSLYWTRYNLFPRNRLGRTRVAVLDISVLSFTLHKMANHVWSCPPALLHWHKLQALVYDILPSTTAVFHYAIGSRKLSANEQFFCWCSNSSTFVTNNSNKTRHVIYEPPIKFTPAQIKPRSSRLNREGTLFFFFFFFFFFLPGVDASHVYVRALALGCFYSHISTRTFRKALTASVDSCAEIKSAPSVA